MLSLGDPDRGTRHVSSWGVRIELIRIEVRATCHRGEGSPYNAPLLTWRFCPGRMGGLKMILLKLLLLFGFSVPRGVAEAKKRKSIYGKLPLLGIPRRHVVSIVERLSVWNTEELSPFK